MDLDLVCVMYNSRNIIVDVQSKKSPNSHDESSPDIDVKETVLLKSLIELRLID